MTKRAVFTLVMVIALFSCPGLSRASSWQDDFNYPEGSVGKPAWRANSIGWTARDGAMAFDIVQKGFLELRQLGQGRKVAIEATVRVEGRRGDSWTIAGVAIRRDPENYWHLALIGSADGSNKFVELIESYEGRWLANLEGPTRLPRTRSKGGDYNWKYGRRYRLRIELSPDGIVGTVREMDGTLRSRLAYKFEDKTAAVKAGWPALDAACATGAFDDVEAEVSEKVQPPEEGRPEFPPYDRPGCPQIDGEKTGYFHVEKHDGAWWLIDPNGNGFYAVGTDHASYHVHWCQDLGYAPYHRNVKEKYGSEEKWARTTADRLNRWGFNAVTARHSTHLRHTHLAHTEWFGAARGFVEVSNIVPRTRWTGFPNVFSPEWPRHCDLVARKLCAGKREDPWLLGYFLDNELQWFGDLSNWRDDYGLWKETWKKPADHSAKQAWIEVAREHCSSIDEFNDAWGRDYESWSALAESTNPRHPDTDEARAMARDYVRLVAERYFKVTTEAIRRHDPNHMILGCRFAGWSPGIWDICGKYCDIVSFNDYPRLDVTRGVPADIVEEYREIHRKANAPLWITEWSFPALDSGLPCKHGAGMRVATQEQKARCYRFFQSTVFSLPFMVGSDYFMYVDEPELGISDSFPEDSNYGLVNVEDEPYETLVRTATRVNKKVCQLHRQGRLESVYEGEPGPQFTPSLPPITKPDPGTPRTITSGSLELTFSNTGCKMRYADKPLGKYVAVIHQKYPDDDWTRPDGARVTALREGQGFTVVDVTFVHENGPAPGYAAGYRLWIPKESSGWFAAQALWVENTSSESWTLADIFHYAIPAIGGDEEGDGPGSLDVPNFYIPFGSWEDPEAGLGQGVFSLTDGLKIRYWKDGDGFHSDCRRPVGKKLAPGQRYEARAFAAIHFGYRTEGRQALLDRLEQVRKEAKAHLR